MSTARLAEPASADRFGDPDRLLLAGLALLTLALAAGWLTATLARADRLGLRG